MQQYLLVTFVDWARLIFLQTYDGWTDRLACRNSDLDSLKTTEANNFLTNLQAKTLFSCMYSLALLSIATCFHIFRVSDTKNPVPVV